MRCRGGFKELATSDLRRSGLCTAQRNNQKRPRQRKASSALTETGGDATTCSAHLSHPSRWREETGKNSSGRDAGGEEPGLNSSASSTSPRPNVSTSCLYVGSSSASALPDSLALSLSSASDSRSHPHSFPRECQTRQRW